jgi:ribokinase
MPKPIVVVGSINIDLVAGTPRIPAPGETIIGNSFATFFGGKGANQAVAAAKLGHPVSMIGRVGDDVFGGRLKAGLEEAGVDTQAVVITPGASGVGMITTDAKGENSIVVVSGANGKVTPADVEAHRSLLLNAGIILGQLEIPMETVEFVAEFAARNGIPHVLDPAPAQSLPASIMHNLTWITPNETETRLLLGSGADMSPQAGAQALHAQGARNVLLKLGSAGVFVSEGGGFQGYVPGFKVNAVDTTAAGDAFNGAFAVALMRGSSTIEAARFANAVAAISVTRHGAQPSMPTQQEVETFIHAQ